ASFPTSSEGAWPCLMTRRRSRVRFSSNGPTSIEPSTWPALRVDTWPRNTRLQPWPEVTWNSSRASSRKRQRPEPRESAAPRHLIDPCDSPNGPIIVDALRPFPVLKVLQLIPTLDRSGAEKQMVLLAKGLPRDRFHVEVATLTRLGPLESELRAAGIPIT